jgi:hypothetical protein
MLKTYTGSCHCGAILFEADVDISFGTGKCNCSICTKMRLWFARVLPNAFRLIKGVSELTDFRGHNPVAHHLFCKHCGVHASEWIDVPNMIGEKYYNINVACHNGLNIDELIAAPVNYYDGRNNDWRSRPIEVRHL